MFKKILLSLIVLLVIFVAASAFVVWRYPMAVFNWKNRRALASAGFSKHTIESRAGTQTVWEKGSGQILVLLHGAGDNAGSFAQVAPEFAARYHVVVPDLAGHAESAPAEGPLSIQSMLDGLDAVINARSGGQPVILVGNSLGAWLATVYANQYPERVDRIVATGGGPLRGERNDLAHLPASREEAARIFEAVMDRGSQKPPGFVLDDIVRQAQSGPMKRMSESKDIEHFLLDGRLQGFQVPVDLVWGESDQLVPLTYAKRMQDVMPATRLTIIPRCGHVPQQECPTSYATILKNTLKMQPPAPRQPQESKKSKQS